MPDDGFAFEVVEEEEDGKEEENVEAFVLPVCR